MEWDTKLDVRCTYTSILDNAIGKTVSTEQFGLIVVVVC